MSDLLNRIDLRFDFVASKLAAHTITEKGCWEYEGAKQKDNYGVMTICDKRLHPRKRKLRAHRVSYAFYNGVDPGELFVCHKCDNPACINPDHLFLGTPLDNTQDMISKGRKSPEDGQNNNAGKLNEGMVLKVLEGIKGGLTNKQIAEELPVTHANVSCIRTGKSWKTLTEKAGYIPEDYKCFNRKPASTTNA